MKRIVIAASSCLLFAAACKDSPKQRAQEVASASSFWPEAPKATSKAGKRLLRYQPANLGNYRMTATGGAPKSSPVALDFDMTLDLRLTAGKTPHERDAALSLMDFDMRGIQKMKMRIDDKGMFIDAGEGAAQTWTRSEPGPFDVAAMVDKPFSTLVFEDDRRMTVRVIDTHPFTALNMGDMLDSGLILFPDLPVDAVAPGGTWQVKRNTAMGASGTRVDVTYDMTYVGDGKCPSGANSCALIDLVASAKDVDIQSPGAAARISFGFAGKIYFNTERGSVDESRVRMDLDAVSKPGKITLATTYVIKPLG
jgi:hypothetical protein